MIDPSTINPLDLPFVPLEQRSTLPNSRGVYFVIDALGAIQYIGSATGKNGFYQRWISTTHHKYGQFKCMDGIKIAYMEIDLPSDKVIEIESVLIEWFQSCLNQNPRPSGLGRQRRLSASMPNRIFVRLEELAAFEGRSISNLVSYLLEEGVERKLENYRKEEKRDYPS